jgi:hypothetical protein
MKFLDKVAFNRLVKIIGDFFLALIKILSPTKSDTNGRRPLRDLLDRWRNK